MDLCTGTGCIPLLLRHELGITRADVRTDLLGVDISSKALKLARLNSMKIHKDYVAEYQGTIQFLQADILLDQAADRQNGLLPLRTALKRAKQPSSWDILISNPPYISPSHYWKTTTRSVRQYEPKLALVPPPKSSFDDIQQGDRFYPRLLDIAKEIEARVVLLEVADMDQAMRVAQAAKDIGIFDGVEIWREHPGAPSDAGSNDSCHGFKVIGEGNGRSVLCYRGIGASWLGKTGTVTETVPEI